MKQEESKNVDLVYICLRFEEQGQYYCYHTDEQMSVCSVTDGIDSSVCCLYFTNEGYEVYPLFINYGQNSVESEWEAVLNVCNAFKLNSPQKISVPEIGTIYPTLITSFDKKLPEEPGYANIMAYFPYRNLFLLTIAAIYAAKKQIPYIGIGLVDTGEGTYRDCSPEFIGLANSIISFEKPLQILAPFAGKSKDTVIDYGNKQGLDFSITYSCSYQPKKPCLKCASCQSRMEAFNKKTSGAKRLGGLV